VLAIAVSLVPALHAQQTSVVQELLRDPAVKVALDAARRAEPRTIDDQVRFCEVPAPPFGESARGEVLRREFIAAGLRNVRVDRAGNVLGDRPGTMAQPRLVLAAHLDTVFPEGTDVRVKREGPVLRGPGIGDNCRGLAVLVRVVRSLAEARVQTPGSITFVANVGEEGLGDLRGMRALFGETMKGQIDRFVSIDSTGVHVTHLAVGSQRYRVTFKGPGGHSYAAFGLPNPIGALGRAITRIGDLQVPGYPRTTFNVGRVGGGTSVNAIPFEGWMEVDLRSTDPAALAALVEQFNGLVDAAAAEENARWGRSGVVTVVKERVGDRPAGSTALDAPIVQIALAAATALGVSAPLGEGSTDANIPISLRIPAITIGAGGTGSDAHALTESFDTTNAVKGVEHALLVTIALAQR
jgi:acetylornithine deacetylase/succinyl-diaminopimelate desuccinylase-like protein